MTDQTTTTLGQADMATNGIVSVNSRGGRPGAISGRLIFAVAIVAMLIMGGAMATYRFRQMKKADDAAGRLAAAGADKQTETGERRIFNTDPSPLPVTSAAKSALPLPLAICPDKTVGQALLTPDGRPMTAPSGQAMRVCSNGQIMMPSSTLQAIDAGVSPPAYAASSTQSVSVPAAMRASRYGGEILLQAAGQKGTGASLPVSNPYIEALLRTQSAGSKPQAAEENQSSLSLATPSIDGGSAQGPLGGQLKGAEAKPVSAKLIGNRDMILPEGRTIDCNLSLRIISEVSGKATCVLSSDVFSDNGKVVLAERGSTAVGEYVARTAQGQRRLFILWTRLETPFGVIVNVNSPAADALGTSGLPGYVDNRWSERIGAAVLLSLVDDVIGYETAKAASANGNSGAQGVAVFQSTTQTGQHLAEKILDSTINIKPTIYKHQGDRATIFVSRDLDFGSVYALRKN